MFEFNVRLKNGHHTPDIVNKDEIVSWYNDRMEGFDEILDVFNIVVSHTDNHYWIAFDTAREVDDVLEMLIDPDDDGNYPIMYDGIPYLIMGHLMPP